MVLAAGEPEAGIRQRQLARVGGEGRALHVEHGGDVEAEVAGPLALWTFAIFAARAVIDFDA